MILYPKGYFNKISEISLEYINENHIKGLILDVDNTLIDYDRNITEDTINWARMLKQNDIKMCILSNSNKHEKVREVAAKLDMEYSYFAMKPFKSGFKKAQKMLNLESKNIAVVGDQIFTDVIGANRMNMHSILVEPIAEKDILVTLIKRPLENFIKHKFLKQKEKEEINHKPNAQSLDYLKKDIINTEPIEKTEGRTKRNTKEDRDVL